MATVLRPSQSRCAARVSRLLPPKASADAISITPARAPESASVRAIDYRTAYMAHQALMAYDQPAVLRTRSDKPTALKPDKSRGMFFFNDSNVGNVVLDVMSGVLKVAIDGGTGLPSKAGFAGALKQSARYIEVLNGFSVASTYPVAGRGSVTWDEDHQLLVSFDTPDPAITKDFTVKLVHEGFTVPEADNLRERFNNNFKNFFNRAVDDVLGSATVSLSATDVAALKQGSVLARDVNLQDSNGAAAGTVTLKLTYSAFSDDAGVSRDDWKVSPSVPETLDGEAAASQEAWSQMMPIALALEGANEVTLERVAFLDHVESDTQVWFSRSAETKQVVVAFRGSSDVNDFKIDSNFAWTDIQLPGCPAARVHSGFLASWLAVDVEVSTLVAACIPKGDSRNWRVTTVGHSLGGSLASLAAYYLAASDAEYEVSMVSVASPRTGNKAFARAWQKEGGSAVRIVDGVRIANSKDIVPKYPFLRSRWIPAIWGISKLVAPPQDRGANPDDQYNHTMCKALILHRERDHGVRVECFDQGEETTTLLDNDIRILRQVLQFGPIVFSEHIFNYSLLLRDALAAESA